MPIEQYTYWSITINNPDENDYLIVRNPNPKYIRELVWTKEVGEEGTEHIQGWVRLQRNQSQAFMKKLFPRAHLKQCDKDVYNENCHDYAQKEDETTAGKHHITLNDPLPANDTLLYKVLEKSLENLFEREPLLFDHYQNEGIEDVLSRITLTRLITDIVEREMITERAGLEKIIISPAYEKMKMKYWREILIRLFKHKQEDATTHDKDERSSGQPEDHSHRSGESEDYEDSASETDEGHSEGTSDQTDEDFDG